MLYLINKLKNIKIDFNYNKFFAVLLTILYISGLISVFYHHEIILAFIVLLCLSFLVFISNIGFRKTIILYLIFFIGILRANQSLNIEKFIENLNSDNTEIEGKIISPSNILNKNNKIKFYLKTDKIFVFNKTFNTKTKILINLDLYNDIENKIHIGDYIKLKGKIRTPQESSNPYQFDYKNYLLNNDCAYVFYGENVTFEKIKEVKFSKNLEDDWYLILRKFENTRNKILKVHSKNIKSPNLEILGGIVFGNETINPDEEIKESFKNSGLLHLLAASGLNVALIFGIWYWLCNMIKFPYNLSIVSGCVFIILYTFMTGFPPSILRASLMLLFILIGKLIDRSSNSIALIFFVGFLILLFNPKMIFDIGFQLSFVVTFGLIVCCPVIISKFDKWDKKYKEKYKKSSRIQKYFLFLFSPSSLASIITVPLIAQIWVAPLQMHYFNTFAPYSILANIIVVSFIGILSFIGFISSIIALIPYLNEPIVFLFDFIANPLLTLLIKISLFFSSFKNSLISVNSLNVFQIFNFWIVVLLFILNLKNNFKNKKHIIIFKISILIFIFSFIKFDYFKNNLEIIMFDVQNADSFLIKTPKNKYILIDTGKKAYRGFSSGEAIINRYLKNERINKLDIMIITHFDVDHSGGAVDILKNNKVNQIFIQRETDKSQTSKEIINYLKDNKLNYKIAKNNETIYQEKNLILKTFTNFDIDENEASIISLLNYKNQNILFMADSGIKGFKINQKYMPDKILILKIGHHGAKNVINNDMIKKLKPDYALISTGINKYGHPHYSTISLLEENNIKMISTKNYGFVKIILNKDINFYHFNKFKKKIEKLNYNLNEILPFHKTKFVQDFIKENL